MSVNSISGISSLANISVTSSNFGGLKAETIKRLKELGIDPSSVKTEAEAQKRITEAEQQKKVQNEKSTQTQQGSSTSQVDMKQLHDDIKSLGDKLGINVSTITDLDKVADTLKLGVDEFVKGASAQANVADKAVVKLNNGTEVKEDPKKIQTDYQDIKDRIDKEKNNKNSMYAGQDMLALMNKYALGIS